MGEGDREPPEAPPSDPEAWTDEQWIAWLKATDDDPSEPSGPVTPGARIVRSSGGQVLGQTMLALAHAIYGRRDDDIVVVAEGPGEGGEDEPYTVHVDRDHPERSTVVFRDVPEPDIGDDSESVG